jgi:hypothetical protein
VKRLVTRHGNVEVAQMDGYLIDERQLDRIMLQVRDVGDGTLDVTFHSRDDRYLAQFSDALKAQWLEDAMLHLELGCPLESLEGDAAWTMDDAPGTMRSVLRSMRPAKNDSDLPPGLSFLQRD